MSPQFLALLLASATARTTLGITSPTGCPGGEAPTYNGICLPTQFPPRQNYSRDVPQPPYLKHPPPLINITIGRQLFVDDFLVQNMSSLSRTFHTAQYYEDNPVLVPDQKWEVTPHRHQPSIVHQSAHPFIQHAYRTTHLCIHPPLIN